MKVAGRRAWDLRSTLKEWSVSIDAVLNEHQIRTDCNPCRVSLLGMHTIHFDYFLNAMLGTSIEHGYQFTTQSCFEFQVAVTLQKLYYQIWQLPNQITYIVVWGSCLLLIPFEHICLKAFLLPIWQREA